MSNPAAEFFTAPTEVLEAIKSQTTVASSFLKIPNSTSASSSGISIGKVIVGASLLLIGWQAWEFYKRRDKILYPEPRKPESIYNR